MNVGASAFSNRYWRFDWLPFDRWSMATLSDDSNRRGRESTVETEPRPSYGLGVRSPSPVTGRVQALPQHPEHPVHI